MPTELWVKKMMDAADLHGLIDPTDFVLISISFLDRLISILRE